MNAKSLISAGLFVTAVSMLPACSRDEPEVTPVLRKVRAEQVFAAGSSRERQFSGVARSGMESKLSFKVPGTLETVAVKVGDQVRKGQLIAEIDSEDYRLQVQDTQASLNQATSQERNASAEYERVRGMYESKNASRQDLDAARMGQESAAANVESIQKRLALTSNQLSYTRLLAPVDGAIAACDVEVNENVSAGQVICLLNSGSEIEVEVSIPEVLITQIREGDAIAVAFDALPGRSLPGLVTEVGVAATTLATTYPVIVRLDREDDNIRSGMAAEVTFEFSAGGNTRILVRPFAVGEDADGRFVYTVVPGAEPGTNVAKRTPVAVGELRSDGIEIVQGLSDGDYVVTAGVSKLTDGQKIRFDVVEEN